MARKTPQVPASSLKLAAWGRERNGRLSVLVDVALRRQRLNDFEELPHAKYILSMVAAVSLGAATPAIAYDSGSLLSMQEALGVAFEVGIAAVSDAEFAGHEWQIEGRDVAGRYMEVDVDATTGAVLNVDR